MKSTESFSICDLWYACLRLSFHLRSAAVVILRDSGGFFMLRIDRVFDPDGRIFPCTVVAFLGMIWGVHASLMVSQLREGPGRVFVYLDTNG